MLLKFQVLCFLATVISSQARTRVRYGGRQINALLVDYDKSKPPSEDGPTEVRLGIYVNNFYNIDEVKMEYSMDMYLRQSWTDPRLAFDGNESMDIGFDVMDRVWVPDVFFRNVKSAAFHLVTVPNKLMRVNSTGSVWYVVKITGVFQCPMKLQKYPMDTQSCPILFESFGYTMDVVELTWLDSPVDVDPGIQLPEYTLEDTILHDCSQNYTSGSFPCLEIKFLLERDFGHTVLQVFIPSALMVILSWLAFWIDINDTTSRVLISIITIIIVTMTASSMKSTLPVVSYITAIDVWSLVCIAFVFLALLEFVVARALMRRGDSAGGEGASSEADLKGKQKASRIDWISRIVFPVAFLLFLIIYGAVYGA